jgi:hypothetical protein
MSWESGCWNCSRESIRFLAASVKAWRALGHNRCFAGKSQVP